MREKVLTGLLMLNLVICGMWIGAPIEETHHVLIVATMIICAIYIVVTTNKMKLIRSKVDWFVLLLLVSTFIPLLCGTAVSITSHIKYMLKYITAILLYICIREHVTYYPETKKQIINTIIGISILLIIIGMDHMSAHIFTGILNFIGIQIQEIELNRLSSVFCYANALAIAIGISIILNNANYLNAQNRMAKGLYGGITGILMMGLLLTYSRLAILVIGVFLIVYMMMLKNKKQILHLIKLFFITAIMAYVYNSIFFSFVNSQKYVFMWCITIAFYVINFIILYITTDLEDKLKENWLKVILIISIVVFAIGFILAFSITGSLDLFKKGRKEYELQVRNLLPETQYCMKFEFEEIICSSDMENLTIEVIEMDHFFDEIYTTKISQTDFIQNKQIDIITQPTTDKLKIVFKQQQPNCKIVIKELQINGQNHVLDYKLIPDKLEERIVNTFMSGKGIWERVVFIQDGLKLLQDGFLFGKGGNVWEYEQYHYQQYYYMATQMHSYILQVGIEYGISAIIAVIGMIVLSIRQYFINKEKQTVMGISILLSLLVLVVHSSIDFEMTYLYVLQLFFVLIAMLSVSNQIKKESSSKTQKIVIIGVLMMILGLYGTLRPYYDSTIKEKKIKRLGQNYYQKNADRKKIDEELIKQYEEYFKLEKHHITNQNMYFNYIHVLQRNLSEDNISQTAEKLEKLYDEIVKMNPNYDIKTKMIKYRESNLTADKIRYSKIKNEGLEMLKQKYYQIIIDEYEETKRLIMKNYHLCRISKQESENYLEELTQLYEHSQKGIKENGRGFN